MDRVRWNVIKIFTEVGFKIEIETHLYMTFNLANGTYRPYIKANESLFYTKTTSYRPP